MSQWGCDTNVVIPESAEPHSINGSIVKNLDINSIYSSFILKRNDTIVDNAEIIIDDDTLAFLDSIYYITYDSAAAITTGNYHVYVKNGSLEDSIGFTIPANLSITDVALPEDRTNAAGNPVQMSWSLSPGNDGYIVGVILKDSAYITDGYSFFSVDGAPQATIPPDAFRIYDDLDTGWYNVYVYSFTGWPEFDDNIPTTLPAGFTDTIALQYLSGHFGTVVVSGRDSIHVVEGL